MNSRKANSLRIEFADNASIALLSGEYNQHLAHIEKSLDVTVDSFGNSIKISGTSNATKLARRVIEGLYSCIVDEGREEIDKAMVDDVLNWAENGNRPDTNIALVNFETWKKKILRRQKARKSILILRKNEVVFGLGPAGTGKTYIAVACAVEALKRSEVDRIILSRPAVEAGERLGFLPGDMKEK